MESRQKAQAVIMTGSVFVDGQRVDKPGTAVPNTAMAQELFNSCVAYGGKAWDHSAMVRALEKMSNFEIGQKAE